MTENESSAGASPEDGYTAADRQTRELAPAMLRGWHRRCPNCGNGSMMSGYLTVRSSCPSCGEDFSHHRAEDAPGWITMLVVGFVVVLGLVIVEVKFAPPLWVHWTIWPAITVGLSLWLLPRLKGAIIAFQWARRMHGFGGSEPG